ncbi:MAG: glycosyltransferase family 4 protein [Sedimentisphaerales bacterium]|jgi:glycosyltransferase involved in cell wall biosynthesis
MDIPNPKLCIITTIAGSIKSFYRGQIDALNRAGFKTTVVCAYDAALASELPADTDFVPVNFSRVISPFKDIIALWQLFRLFRKRNFDIVQYSTPKAALLASIASFTARVPIRIYILWGLYYTGTKGFGKFILKSFEKIICCLSTHIVPIAHEMVAFAESEGLAPAAKCEVMLNGSAKGVDLQLFDPDKYRDAGRHVREQYNIPAEAVVIGTMARLTKDKGICELVTAFEKLARDIQTIHLLIVGEQETKDRLPQDIGQMITSHPRIHAVGRQNMPVPYFAAMDIFCLPTYREGFGEVNLEAQAMKLPAVSTNIVGPRESIADGQTGFLVEPRNSEALIQPLRTLILDAALRRQMGDKARQRVEQMFDQNDMIEAVVRHRHKLISDEEKK